jgi:hypothetical protein
MGSFTSNYRVYTYDDDCMIAIRKVRTRCSLQDLVADAHGCRTEERIVIRDFCNRARRNRPDSRERERERPWLLFLLTRLDRGERLVCHAGNGLPIRLGYLVVIAPGGIGNFFRKAGGNELVLRVNAQQVKAGQ